MNASLKQLAKKARNRLKTAGEITTKTEVTTTASLAATTSYTMVANIRKIEDDPLFNKVKKVLIKSKEELVINPLSMLIDNKYYSALPSADKERYILKLTKKYNKIKDYILLNNLLDPEE